MSAIKVSGGGGGTFTVTVEGGPSVEVSESLTAYQAAHELAPFMQALLDSVPVLDAPPEPARKSKAPPKGDA